ncbi:MAG: TetR/AcrR family transcriptional regulator [Acidobacteria bacterium]|nr:MAG: TetR/AcrR family transcriptional regulator [Acidobacteriota bacterium]
MFRISTDRYIIPEVERSPSEQRFLDAALELFSEKGYEATSVREICEQAGITRPTLYYFFKSKEGIYRALIEDAAAEFHEQIAQGLEAEQTLERQYKQVARVLFGDARSRAKRWRFMFSLVWATPRMPVVDQVFHTSYCHALKLLGSAMEKAVARREIAPGPTQVRLLVFMGSLGEALSGFLITGQPELTDHLADSLVDTIIYGWRPEK